MLIGGDDICNDVITLGTCFSMFGYICARFRFALIAGKLTAQSTGSHRGVGGGIQIPETRLQALLPFPTPPPERPAELAPGCPFVCVFFLCIDISDNTDFYYITEPPCGGTTVKKYPTHPPTQHLIQHHLCNKIM